MKKVTKTVLKKVSNKEISVKKNYKLLRTLQKMINPIVGNQDSYEDVLFHLGDRTINARVFKPVNKSKSHQLIIFIHGGGWVTGCVDSYTNTCIDLSNKTNRIVIAIDYRLAPEHPYPAGFCDCYDCVKLIMEHLSTIGLNSKDICLMGDSAGGNLVAAISLKSRKTKDFRIYHQILLYPALQSDYSNRTKYKSVIENGKDFLLTQKQLQDYMSLYVKDTKDLNSPYVSPLKAKFPIFQPRTLIITCDSDPLRDEGLSYAKKLKRYFNYVEYYNFEGAIHGFLSQPLGKKYKGKAYDRIIEFLRDDNE